MSAGISYRLATAEDAPGIARVVVDTWRTTYRGIMPDSKLDSLNYSEAAQRWRNRFFEGLNGVVWLAETDPGEIIGYASCGKEKAGDPEFPGELHAIYIMDAYQKQGIGRQLFMRSAQWLYEHGYHAMLLWVLADNPSRIFYEKMGGERVRTKYYEIDGVTLEAIGYGWHSLHPLLP
jgi:GNAT superfamily N-acetyltransferase